MNEKTEGVNNKLHALNGVDGQIHFCLAKWNAKQKQLIKPFENYVFSPFWLYNVIWTDNLILSINQVEIVTIATNWNSKFLTLLVVFNQ